MDGRLKCLLALQVVNLLVGRAEVETDDEATEILEIAKTMLNELEWKAERG